VCNDGCLCVAWAVIVWFLGVNFVYVLIVVGGGVAYEWYWLGLCGEAGRGEY